MKLIDITGQRFGRLTVIRKHNLPAKNGGSLWVCMCDCGTEKVVNATSMRGKISKTRSCGCLAKEQASWLGSNPAFTEKRIAKLTRHGHKRVGQMTAEYRTWLGIKRRCYDTKCKDFPNWGGRGIGVCEEWRTSFEAFLAAMGARPAGHTIDRLNPDLDYSPENCRWAPQREQGALHRRNLRAVTINGVPYPSISAAARAFGVLTTTINERLRRGISLEEAVATPTRALPNRRPRESYLRKDRRA